jgi:hypothetical protein
LAQEQGIHSKEHISAARLEADATPHGARPLAWSAS